MKVVKNQDGTWRVTGVPIVSTGIEYPLSTGFCTFTDNHLASAVKALKDPAIVAPRIKLGHSSLYNDELIDDAEPAFGRIDAETMHLGDNGQTIYGDYTGMPEWLAKVLPQAYPNRSVEGNFDVKTVTGRSYEFVINAVSLLGVKWPGVSVLDDLPLWYGAETPDGAEVDVLVRAAGGGMSDIRASVDVDQVRRKFYTEVAVGDDYWLWVRGMKYDSDTGLQLIVDNEQSGDLFRLPVKIEDNVIEFGERIPVVEEFSDKRVAATAVIAGMRLGDPSMLVYATRAESRPDVNNQEGATMDEATRRALAVRLGLPEDASEDQINSAIDAGRSAVAASVQEGEPATPPAVPAPEAPPPPTDPETPPAEPGEEPGEGEPEGEPEGEGVEAGIVHLDRATFNELKAGAALAKKHEASQQKDRIIRTVAAAVEAGKIAPARRRHWETALAADFDGAKATLDSLESGLIPTEARGVPGNSGDGTSGDDGLGLPEGWFPEIAQIRAGAGQGRRVLQAREG